jgi:protein SCO1/2
MLLLFLPVSGQAQLAVDPGQSAGASPTIFKQVRFDQRLGEQIPLDLYFQDEHGHEVRLRQFFGERPVILTLAYYHCPMLCTELLNGLVRTLRQMNLEIGKDYEVVTVSIDPGDSSALAATKHEAYSVMYGRPGALTGWHFLTGQEPQIHELARAVGFQYAFDPASQQFAHASGIMILSPDGVLSQYTYGVSFPERDLRLGILRASQKQVGSVVDQVLLYCYHYDPHTGKYGLLISHVLQIAGGVTLVALGSVIFVLFRKESYTVPNSPKPSHSAAHSPGVLK